MNGNTNLEHFVSCLEIIKSEKGVIEWMRSWLDTQGVVLIKHQL